MPMPAISASIDEVSSPCKPFQATTVKVAVVHEGEAERAETSYSSCNRSRTYLPDAERIGPIGHTTTGVT